MLHHELMRSDAGGDNGLRARAEHIFQALKLKPPSGVSEFDVAEAAEVIRLLAVRGVALQLHIEELERLLHLPDQLVSAIMGRGRLADA